MKDFLARILIPKRLEALERAKEEYEGAKAASDGLKREYEALRDEQKRKIESIDVVDAFRANMRGYDMRLLDEKGSLLDAADLAEGEGLNEFLSKAHDIANSPVFKRIMAFLKRNQIHHAAVEGKTLDEINFARATLNALTLLEEELEALDGVYKERNAPEEGYDVHEVV